MDKCVHWGRFFVTLILATGGVLLCVVLSRAPPLQGSGQPQMAVALSILQSQDMAFLVTRQASTQIVVEFYDEDIWGRSRGLLWATVSWRWGIDMQKLTAEDARVIDGVLHVRLPEPRLLDFSIEPGSMGYMTKATAVPWFRMQMADGLGRAAMEKKLRDKAIEFMASHELAPTRQEIVGQLNRMASALGHPQGQVVRFE